jgi:hypothetical protein
MEGKLIIIPITQLGKDKIKEHVEDTTPNEANQLKTKGIIQTLQGEILILDFQDRRIKFIAKRMPEQLITLLDAKKSNLTDEMSKLGIVENIDYKIEYG